MTRINAITLGGKAVISLDSGSRTGCAINERDFAALLPRRIDIDRLVGVVGLEAEELEYMRARKVDGLRGRQLAAYLGWPDATVEACRKRVARKLKNFDAHSHDPEDFIIRGSSTHLCSEQHLGDGLRCYRLTELSTGFAELMESERRFASDTPRRVPKSFVA